MNGRHQFPPSSVTNTPAGDTAQSRFALIGSITRFEQYVCGSDVFGKAPEQSAHVTLPPGWTFPRQTGENEAPNPLKYPMYKVVGSLGWTALARMTKLWRHFQGKAC